MSSSQKGTCLLGFFDTPKYRLELGYVFIKIIDIIKLL